jgi:hypothetical protein
MASKAGRVQFKDIKAGKTFWMVRGGAQLDDGIRAGLHPVDVWREPLRVVVKGKPFRTEIDDRIGRRRREWSFEARMIWDAEWSEDIYIDCGMFGIVTDVWQLPIHPCVDYLFTTRAAAIRYRERMERSQNYRVAFEHPAHWTRTKLRKRIGANFNGTPAIYGDWPTRTNAHRPWLWTAPLETLIGGIVIGPKVSKQSRERLHELTNNDVMHMYPNRIIAHGSLEKLKHDDEIAKVSIKPLKSPMVLGIDPAGADPLKISSLVIGNGDKITKVYTEEELNSIYRTAQRVITTPAADRHVRALHRGTVIVSRTAMQDPAQRAQLEKDFVIIDEAHIFDKDPNGFTKLVEEFKAAEGYPVGQNIEAKKEN